MSFSRCGLQYQRESSISKDIHNHPRSKQMQCWIVGDSIKPKESTISTEVVGQEKKDMVSNVEQEGSGMFDIIRSLPYKRIGEKIAAEASNLFPSSDKNARDVFPGEYHAIVKLPNGKYGRANYTGPGTHITERLKRDGGDPPRVLSDKVSQAHDIRYALAQLDQDPEKKVREADNIFVRKMGQLSRSGLDSSVNIQPAMRTIQAKMAAEDFGLLSRSKFINTKSSYSDPDIKLMKNKLSGLQQEGYGTSLAGGYSVQSRGKTRLGPSDKGNRKSQTTSGTSSRFFKNLVGGAQAPGTQVTTASQNINVKTAKSHPVVNLRSTYFDNQYGRDKRRGFSRELKQYGEIQGQRHVEASHYGGGDDSAQIGGGYPGDKRIKISAPNFSGKGVVLAGGGSQDKIRSIFPADKLLKKMRKKIKNKKARNLYYGGDRAMSHFLADKLVPMISAY